MDSLLRNEDIKKLKNAKIILSSLDIIGFLGFLLTVFELHPLELWIFINIFIPLLAVFTMWLYKGLAETIDKEFIILSILFATLFPSIGLLSHIESYNVVHSIIFWVYFISLSGFLIVFSYRVTIKNLSAKIIILVMWTNIIIYSYGVIIQVNCLFDYSIPKQYSLKVLDSWEGGGRGITDYLMVSGWGHFEKEVPIVVPEDFYNDVEIGDNIKINYKRGLLGLNWFYPQK